MATISIKLKVLGKRDFNGRDDDDKPHTQLELTTDDALGGHIAIDVSQAIGKSIHIGQVISGSLSI